MLMVLHAIDVATRCWIEQKQINVLDIAALKTGLELTEIELNCVYDLGPADLRHIEETFGARFENQSAPVEMVVFDRKYPFDENSHTGRELLLMLAGKKPMAAFVEVYGSAAPEGAIPEDLFEPHVVNGTFCKKIVISEQSHSGPLRRVLYAVRGEEWRMDSYAMLWELGHKHGWNEGFEKMEGLLLGYETEIDPFFSVG